jgi:hypothetical protein
VAALFLTFLLRVPVENHDYDFFLGWGLIMGAFLLAVGLCSWVVLEL